MPDEPEALALLALMRLHDSRRATRIGADGRLVLLEDQDRAAWDREAIAEGLTLTERALALGDRGRYAVQAVIAAEHARAPRAQDTDWATIAAAYARLVGDRPEPGDRAQPRGGGGDGLRARGRAGARRRAGGGARRVPPAARHAGGPAAAARPGLGGRGRPTGGPCRSRPSPSSASSSPSASPSWSERRARREGEEGAGRIGVRATPAVRAERIWLRRLAPLVCATPAGRADRRRLLGPAGASLRPPRRRSAR